MAWKYIYISKLAQNWMVKSSKSPIVLRINRFLFENHIKLKSTLGLLLDYNTNKIIFNKLYAIKVLLGLLKTYVFIALRQYICLYLILRHNYLN